MRFILVSRLSRSSRTCAAKTPQTAPERQGSSSQKVKTRPITFLLLAAVFLRLVGLAVPSNAQSVFVHQGMINTITELNAQAALITSGDPVMVVKLTWGKSFLCAPLSYTPKPTTDGIVSSDIGGANNHFAAEIVADSTAAYCEALLYVLTGNTTYADNASKILLAWANANLVAGSFQGVNWILNAAWSSIAFAPAAELLRASGYTGWTQGGPGTNIDKVKTMFDGAYLPVLHRRLEHGNRGFAEFNALMAIGVFNDDPAAYAEGLHNLQSYIPAYYYSASLDGSLPRVPDWWVTMPTDAALTAMNNAVGADVSWINNSGLHNWGSDSTALTNAYNTQNVSGLWGFASAGVAQYCDAYTSETHGRDLSHVDSAMAWTALASEIARQQGTDVWGPNAPRLAPAADLQAFLQLNPPANAGCGAISLGNGLATGATWPMYRRLSIYGIPMPNLEYTIAYVTNVIKSKLYDPPSWPTIFSSGLIAKLNAQSVTRVWGESLPNTLTHYTVNAATTPNFTISATPSSQTVLAGAGTSYAATVTPSGGFTGNASFSVSGLPSGATGSFNPTSVAGSGSSTLSISTSSTTPVGTYPLTIKGTSGSLVRSTTVTLVVNAATADFTISATPSSQTVLAGAGTSYSATVTPSGGFTGNASFSVSGLPSGVTGSFSPTSVAGSGSSTLSVSTNSTTQVGAYPLTITGTSGSLVHSTTATLVVNSETCQTATNSWSNTAFTAQTGTFTATFNGIPSANGIDTVMGLSDGPQSAYGNLAAIVRFNSSGNIDAFNQTAYSAASTIPYTGGTTYSFEFDVNVPAQTYTVYVTPQGGSQILVGQDYGFRLSATTLNNLSLYALVGSASVCGFSIPSTVQLITVATLSKLSDGSYQATVTITNNGTGTAQNVQLTGATLGSAAGAPNPQPLGDIVPGGGSVSVVVTFPSSAGASGAGAAERYTGSYSGGTFGGSIRAILP